MAQNVIIRSWHSASSGNPLIEIRGGEIINLLPANAPLSDVALTVIALCEARSIISAYGSYANQQAAGPNQPGSQES